MFKRSESRMSFLYSVDMWTVCVLLVAMVTVGVYCEASKEHYVVATEDLRCATHLTQLEVSHPGCIPKPVYTTACRGVCRSYAHPEWSTTLKDIHMVHNCNCCKPTHKRYRYVTLECPGRLGPKTMRVSGVDGCRCRPCSDHKPEAEQPYDY